MGLPMGLPEMARITEMPLCIVDSGQGRLPEPPGGVFLVVNEILRGV
jgi:hypothetical protein